MPDHLTGIRSEYEPCSIQRISIKEVKAFLDSFLKRCVPACIRCLCNLEIHMEFRSCCFAVLHLHVVTAEGNYIGNIRQHPIQLFRCNPLCRILGVIIVDIHHHHIRPGKVSDASIISFVLSADMIEPDCFPHFLRRGHHPPVRIAAVSGLPGAVCCKHGYLHTSNLFS